MLLCHLPHEVTHVYNESKPQQESWGALQPGVSLDFPVGWHKNVDTISFFLQPAINGFLLLVSNSAQTKLSWKIRTWHTVSGRSGRDTPWAEMSKMTENHQVSLQRVPNLIILISTSEQKAYDIYLIRSYEDPKSSCIKQSKSPSATQPVFIKPVSLLPFFPYSVLQADNKAAFHLHIFITQQCLLGLINTCGMTEGGD